MAGTQRFIDVFGHTVELATERWLHVLEAHQELKVLEDLIPKTLQAPDVVMSSVHDPKARLYYRFFDQVWHGKYLVVVVQSNHQRAILTAYLTDKIKRGERLWPSS